MTNRSIPYPQRIPMTVRHQLSLKTCFASFNGPFQFFFFICKSIMLIDSHIRQS
uniref:Uncharacterized protein n=1 Tax=Arundo donax TaxID=35708 RepID=A0A0A9B392_ARUDO